MRYFVCFSLVMLLTSGCGSKFTSISTPPAPELAAKPNCTAAPERPASAPFSWSEVVHPNCFTNLERLKRWTGGSAPLLANQSPQPFFVPVLPKSLGTGTAATDIYVFVHGWAPGYRANVTQTNFALQWWDTATAISNVWPSNWAWFPTTATDPDVTVTDRGVFQELQRASPNAIVLGYSWTDDAATDGGFLNNPEVYQSEAYTNINGLRLANALQQAIDDTFWGNPNNRLHMIGHSHGSKVAKVATLALQLNGLFANHLTVLDSPESEVTLKFNGSSLLGFYLAQLITLPTDVTAGTFVDSYVSEFGANFTSTQSPGSVVFNHLVQGNLEPSEIYGITGVGDNHSYAAAWYGGSKFDAQANHLPPVGLDWPPPPKVFRPALNQNLSNRIPAGISSSAPMHRSSGKKTFCW